MAHIWAKKAYMKDKGQCPEALPGLKEIVWGIALGKMFTKYDGRSGVSEAEMGDGGAM